MSSFISNITDSVTGSKTFQMAKGFAEGFLGGSSLEQKYAKLEPEKVSQLVYPENLLDSEMGMGHFLLININRIVGSKFGDRDDYVENEGEVKSGEGVRIQQGRSGSVRANPYFRNYKQSKESICVQMPQQIIANYGSDWSVTQLGAMGTAIHSGTAIVNGNFSASGLAKAAARSLGETALAATDFVTPGNLQDAYQLYMGEQSNPYVEVLFKSSTRRDHQLSFVFTPKNERESQIVREIIYRLKFHMHAELKAGATRSSYLGSPSTFDLTFMTRDGRNQWLHKVATCALSNVSVNYQASDRYTVHDDDSPAAIVVECVFVELEVLTKDRFNSSGESY